MCKYLLRNGQQTKGGGGGNTVVPLRWSTASSADKTRSD